jgi:hypothetical protein
MVEVDSFYNLPLALASGLVEKKYKALAEVQSSIYSLQL